MWPVALVWVVLASPNEGAVCQRSNPMLRAPLTTNAPYLPRNTLKPAVNACATEPDLLRLWSSSFLAPEKSGPKLVPDSLDAAHQRSASTNAARTIAWCGQYSAWSTADGNLATAWCEGVEGAGVGEIVISPVAYPWQKVQIAIGHQKSAALFKANGRPRLVRVYVLEEAALPRTPCPYSAAKAPETMGRDWKRFIATGVHAIAQDEVTLRDVEGYQPLPMPSFSPRPGYSYFVAVELRSVTPGAKYDDTCIAEIGNVKG